MRTIIKRGLVTNKALKFTCEFCECEYETHLASLDKNERTLRSSAIDYKSTPGAYEFILTSYCPQCQFPNQIHSPKAREIKNHEQ